MSEEEGAIYRAKMGIRDTRSHDDIDSGSAWKQIPKPLLVAVVLLLATIVSGFEAEWRLDVKKGLRSVQELATRTDKLEAADTAREKAIGSIQLDVGRVREDQLSFYRWTAERSGDYSKAQQYGRQLREVQVRNDAVERKVGPLPSPTPVPSSPVLPPISRP